MNKPVEQLVKACYQCQLVGPRPKLEPVRSTKPPGGLWNDIAVDLLEVLAGNHLLVVVRGRFKTPGFSQTVRSDNCPPFASTEFASFSEHLGIEPRKGLHY